MNEPRLHIHNVHFARGHEIWPGTAGKRGDEFRATLKRLSRRALVMAGPDDGVIVDGPVEERYMDFLRGLGAGGSTITHPAVSGGASLMDDILKTPETVELVRSWRGPVEPYIIGKGEERLMTATGREAFSATAEVVELLNDKVFFLRMLEDLGLPIIPNFVGNSDAASARLRKWNEGPVIARATRSVGGSRVFTASGRARIDLLADQIEKAGGGLYIIQPLLETISSPNLQFYVTPDEITLFGETSQILVGGLRHEGNYFGRRQAGDFRDEMIGQGVMLAKEAVALGYAGTLGVDFIVTNSGEVYAVEINARINTSTSAIWFMNRLFTGDPLMMAEGARCAFIRLPSVSRGRSGGQWLGALGTLAFDPEKREGIVPYDTGAGELSAALAARDDDALERLMDGARKVAEA